MKKRELIEYLENVIDLEKTVYIQETLESKLRNRINSLGKDRDIPYPVEKHSSFKECFEMSGLVIGMIVGGLMGLFDSDGILSAIFNAFICGLGGIIIGGVIGTLLTPLWYGIGSAMAESRLKEAKQERDIKVSKDRKRVQQELEQAKRLRYVLDELRKKKEETKALLRRFYDHGPIYESYQNVVAVCSFYEYLKSGKCDTLHGHEGAYNIYDVERRLEQILVKLDAILSNLEAIKNTQYKLYNTLQEGNRKMDALLTESVKQSNMLATSIEQNEIIVYNTERAKNELRLANNLKVYELTKKGY